MPTDGLASARETAGGTLKTAPYLAKIVGHLDPTFQGGLEVTLLRESGNQIGDQSQTYIVKYAPPFYGCTAYEFMGKNVDFNDSQKSYGFWGVPPDPGVTGIVIFINGDSSKGFWIACIQDKFVNHMIPAIGSSKHYESKEDFGQGEHPLPVAEHNRKANEMDKNLEIDKIKRAVHPFARRLKQQGLVQDEFRGHSTSTSRREVPSMVFGMSTPGPVDRTGKKGFIGCEQTKTEKPVSIGRLGGTQFVMDDGDDRYYRKTPASEGPPEYLKFLDGKKGNVDIPYNEYFRVRTRTGHQILFHNSEDLIYIANSRGTAWIELTSDGKMDIFCEDSVNIHTQTDFNLLANRDVNIEAKRNVNIKSGKVIHQQSGADWLVNVGANSKLTVKGQSNIRAGGDHVETAANIHMNGPAAATAPAIETFSLPAVAEPAIMTRVPTHEPYPQHENLDPLMFKPGKTDRQAGGSTGPASAWKKYMKPKDNPF